MLAAVVTYLVLNEGIHLKSPFLHPVPVDVTHLIPCISGLKLRLLYINKAVYYWS